MSAQFTIDSSMFTTKTKTMLKQVGKSEAAFLDEQAALLFRDVSKFTAPFGGGKLPTFGRASYGTSKDKKAGEGAIRADLSGIFRQRAQGYLEMVEDVTGTRRNIRQTLRRKDGTPYLIDVDVINYDSVHEAHSWHKKFRDSRGRIQRRNSGDSIIGRWTARDRMWITPEIYAELFLNLAKTVGRGKAYFAWAAQQFGGKQAPKWISRHFWKYRARVVRGEGYRTATATAPQFVHTVRFLNRIEKNRVVSAEKRLMYLTKQAVKKAGFKAA